MVEFAPDSPQVNRARHKLMQEFAEADKKLSSAHERHEEVLKIQHWLQRHKSERIDLKDKEVTTVLEPHLPSVLKLRAAIAAIPGKPASSESLQGRITHHDNK